MTVYQLASIRSNGPGAEEATTLDGTVILATKGVGEMTSAIMPRHLLQKICPICRQHLFLLAHAKSSEMRLLSVRRGCGRMAVRLSYMSGLVPFMGSLS